MAPNAVCTGQSIFEGLITAPEFCWLFNRRGAA
jgi:hypothetical protein